MQKKQSTREEILDAIFMLVYIKRKYNVYSKANKS